MNRKKRKVSMLTMLFFVLGLVIYLTGIILIFSSSFKKIPLFKAFFSNSEISDNITSLKIIGALLFLVGFIIFMISVVLLYKSNNIKEDTKNLIVEGKADVITLIIMTYVMIFMIVICLIYDELIGALLFGITIVIQSVLNSVLVTYYNRQYKKK